MGIAKLVHCSDGSQIENPRFATSKKAKRTLKIRQRRLSRTKKGSKNRRQQVKRVAKLHQQVADRRNAHQWKSANKIIKKTDCIIVEDLNVIGMIRRCKVKQDASGRFLPNGQSAKRGLNRAIADCSWGELIAKIEYVAAKQGKVFLKVNPRHTSQECSKCHHVDAASRDREKFICTACDHIDHADLQAARNIKFRGVEQYKLTLKTVRRDSTKPPRVPIELVLLGTPSTESNSAPSKAETTSRRQRQTQGAWKPEYAARAVLSGYIECELYRIP